MKHFLPPSERDRAIANMHTCAFAALMLLLVLYFGKVVGFVNSLLSAITPFLVGAAFAFILLPLMRRLEAFLQAHLLRRAKPRHTRLISTGICILLLLALIVAFALILLPQVITSMRSLLKLLQRFVNDNEKTINDFLIQNGLITAQRSELNTIWDKLLSTATQYISVVIPNLLAVSSTLYQLIFHLFVGLIAACHFLIEKDAISNRFKKVTYAIFSEETAEQLVYWTRKGNRIFSGYISGKIIDSLIVGFICYLFMMIVGMEYSLLISVIIGVTNVLPFFGPFIGAIPSILILLMANPTNALIFTIFILVLQQLDGNLIGPLILGDHVGITPLWTMIAIIIGSSLFGFVGILVSVPVFALLYALFNALIEIRLRRKQLPLSAEDYAALPREDAAETAADAAPTRRKASRRGKM